jgi:hypothetical protein
MQPEGQPQGDIVVRKAGSYVLWIFATSPAARAIIEQHAPKYGNLYPPRTDHYDLYVSEEYEHDLDSIVDYLQSLG